MAAFALAVSAPAHAQFFRLAGRQMIRYTPDNPYPRFPDGRPKVPDDIIARIKTLAVDPVVILLKEAGYEYQYAGDFRILHPGQKLAGRAFTAQYLPVRPDLEKILVAEAEARGETSRTNNKVIDMLEPGDVPVIDLMSPKPGNNFGGDNLHAAIYGATGTGAVVEGTIRDLEGIHELPSQVYFRDAHPAAVGDVSVAGINVPIRIGPAIVMPGDVVLGDRTGVVFIPPHMVPAVLEKLLRR
jgi:4-hydroxy-4-methyl-2-oxoglutarate aldolase